RAARSTITRTDRAVSQYAKTAALALGDIRIVERRGRPDTLSNHPLDSRSRGARGKPGLRLGDRKVDSRAGATGQQGASRAARDHCTDAADSIRNGQSDLSGARAAGVLRAENGIEEARSHARGRTRDNCGLRSRARVRGSARLAGDWSRNLAPARAPGLAWCWASYPDLLVVPAKAGIHLPVVIPAKAGIHLLPTHFLLSSHPEIDNMDSRFRGNDDSLNPPWRGWRFSEPAFAGMAIPTRTCPARNRLPQSRRPRQRVSPARRCQPQRASRA